MARSAPKQIRYTPADLVDLEPGEMRQIYTRLRKTMKRRQDRLRSAGYGEDKLAKAGWYSAGHYSDTEIRKAVLDISKSLRDPRSLATRRREIEAKTVESLQKTGYSITKSNLRAFGDFMDWSREAYKNYKLPPSDLVAQVYENAVRLNISEDDIKKQFETYLKNVANTQRLERLVKVMNKAEIPNNRTSVSFSYLRREMRALREAENRDQTEDN